MVNAPINAESAIGVHYAVPTLTFLSERGAKIIVPVSSPPSMVANELGTMLEAKVTSANDALQMKGAISSMDNGDVLIVSSADFQSEEGCTRCALPPLFSSP